jgi:tetratricopeptide (TPR) repeat protein
MAHFDSIYLAPRVRVALNSVFEQAYAKKFWQLVEKLRLGQFYIPGLNIEKLYSRKGKLFSARLNQEIRIIFSTFAQGKQRAIVIWDADHHDKAYDRLTRNSGSYLIDQFGLDTDSFDKAEVLDVSSSANELNANETNPNPDGVMLFKVPHFVIADPAKYPNFERSFDRYLLLTEEQESILGHADKAFLVQGSAGCGKTTLALFHAFNLYEMNSEDDIFFFTYHTELACVCRAYKANLIGEEDGEAGKGGLKVFSYLEFCRHYLWKSLDLKKVTWQWINRQVSLKHLNKIIATKSRWQRTVDADDLYNYIYSMFKGRFVPGSSRFAEQAEDFKRIFKAYATIPDNLDDLIEIFQLYQGELKDFNQKDEADLIAYCYQNLKEKAILSDLVQSTWIVIDEIQDFTELEWKSILLFWENKCRQNKQTVCFPFVCGDTNQNISRSGFRWQELDVYVDAILKNMHRPNSLTKVELRQNFRNSKQIFQLGKFIRELAGKTANDLGSPPSSESVKPTILIGKKGEFQEFLLSAAGIANELPAPLTVLFEDDDDLEATEQLAELMLTDNLFLMPVRKSKGLEFEDVIIYRLFAQAQKLNETNLEISVANRSFDLWYMAVTRARNKLLVFLTEDDWSFVKKFLAGHLNDFLPLVDVVDTDVKGHLAEFYRQRETYVPNYNVIFLETNKARSLYDEGNRLIKQAKPGQASFADKGAKLQEEALRLWKKSRDWLSLGKAYYDLKRFREAIPYLTQANELDLLAKCHQELGDFAQAAKYFEEDHNIAQSAYCLEQDKQFAKAAELYELIGDWQKAGSNFIAAGNTLSAAKCYELAGELPLAAELYKQRAKWQKAAELYRQTGNFAQAAELFLKIKDKLDAARCYQSSEQFDKAADLYANLGRWQEAADCFSQAKIYGQASLLYAKGGNLRQAAISAELACEPVKAAQLYERIKEWNLAANLYLQAQMPSKAYECFEYALNWDKAYELAKDSNDSKHLGQCLEHLGRFKQAAECYLQVNAYAQAGTCYEKEENWLEAAKCFVLADNTERAAYAYAQAGQKFVAAKLYLEKGEVLTACELARAIVASDSSANGKYGDLRLQLAAIAEECGKPVVAAQIYDLVGHHLLAAKRYEQASLFDKAATSFEKAKKYDLAASYYEQAGMFERAAAQYLAGNDLKAAASSLEKGKLWLKAKEIYERLGDKDATARCESHARWQ